MTDREGYEGYVEGCIENKPKVGIIGCGFVGSAVAAGFALKTDLKVYDKDPLRSVDSLAETCKQDILFLCLPTPMRQSDGKPELSFIRKALTEIYNTLTFTGQSPNKIIVIKSTVLPGTNRMLQEEFPSFNFVSNPEFLTARSARLDFINASRIIIGIDTRLHLSTKPDVIREIVALYESLSPHIPIYICTWEEAEFVKYMANCFFALKVSYLNEIFLLCESMNMRYDFIKMMWLADGRIGNSHHEVPGHDGDMGFGGTCFPKDISAFTAWARDKGTPICTLDAAKAVNDQIRKKKDWEVFDDLNAE